MRLKATWDYVTQHLWTFYYECNRQENSSVQQQPWRGEKTIYTLAFYGDGAHAYAYLHFYKH